MSVSVYYDKDADLSIIRESKVLVLGYGSQGHAHALNLRDSGVNVTVGLPEESRSRDRAIASGFTVTTPSEGVKEANFVMMLLPDELQASVYKSDIEPNLNPGTTLAFAHGFNIHFGFIKPKSDCDCVMIAPKGPGHTVRDQYTRGAGVPTLIAVSCDNSGNAKSKALSYASAIGGGRVGIINTNFKQETETDLFGEQSVLCGGAMELVVSGFEVLVEAGYDPEMAYFECLHELKLIVDLMYEGGISNMRYSISNTAEYGSVTRGPRLINEQTKQQMREILKEIQSGKFAQEWMDESKKGMPNLKRIRDDFSNHQIEQVGAKLRDMMPWNKGEKLVKE